MPDSGQYCGRSVSGLAIAFFQNQMEAGFAATFQRAHLDAVRIVGAGRVV